MSVKYVVTSLDLLGSVIAKYAQDIDWWARASGQPRTSVDVTSEPDGQFVDVQIAFPPEDAAGPFREYLASYAVRCTRST